VAHSGTRDNSKVESPMNADVNALMLVVLLSLHVQTRAAEQTFNSSPARDWGHTEVVRISGRVVYTVYDGLGNTNRVRSEEFTVDVDGSCRYLIRLLEERSGSDYFEVGYDGTNSYYLNNLTSAVAARRAATPATVGPNVATGIVRASPVPQFSFADCADPIWLTYAAHCYFKDKAQDSLVSPAASNGGKNGDSLTPADFIQLPARFTFDPESDHLSRLSYIHPGRNPVSGERFPAPFHVGFTNVIFRVHSFGQFEGRVLPTRSSMETYYLSFRGGQPQIRKRIEYELQCTNVTVATRAGFRPEIPGVTMFTDERFNDARLRTLHFTYLTNRWLSNAEVRELPEYQRLQAMHIARGRSIGGGPWWIVFAIVFLGVGSLLMLKRKT
jgi:hypothetical protein